MKVLIVDDEPAVASFIKKGLEENGFNTDTAFDGEMAFRLAAQNEYDIILLDVIMPGINGFDLCERIRKDLNYGKTIIMLTALSTVDDVVSGLNRGADDYISKPFKFRELLARINAHLRRGAVVQNIVEMSISNLRVNIDSKEVFRNDEIVKLTAKEFNLLVYLLRNKGRVLSRMDILENVWEVNFDLGTNVVDVYVNYLRNKIDKNFEPKLIQTVVGMGYVVKE